MLGIAFGSAFVNAQLPQGPPSDPRTGFLAGQVVEWPSGKPLAGVTVNVQITGRAGGMAPVITDSQGRFYFAHLPAGNYSPTAIKDGYSYPPSAVVARSTPVGVGERVTDLKVTLVKLGAISGTLRDDAGDPVVGMTVTALKRVLVNGRMTMTGGTRVKSDDRGAYRIPGLQPGEYVICACMLDAMPFDGTLLTTLAAEPIHLMGIAGRALKAGADAVSIDDTLRTFAPTLYPNSTTIARADRVVLKPGEDKSSVDFNLTPTRAVHLSGTILGSASPIGASAIQLIPAGESEEGAAMMRLNPMLIQPDGRFDFVNVPAGSYELRVQTTQTSARGGPPAGQATQLLGSRMSPSPTPPPQSTDPFLWAVAPVQVGDTDISGITVVLKPGPVVSGKIRLLGSATLSPQSLQRMAVIVTTLVPPPGVPSARNGYPINPDLTFRVPWVIPGRYQLSVISTPEYPTLKSVEAGNLDVTDLPIDINADVTDVVITVSDAPLASLAGTALKMGTVDNLTALIFPADRRLWPEPEAAYRRYRAVAVARDGAFTAPQLLGGDYFIAIVPDADTADWQQPAKLEAWSKTATRVTLLDGEKKTIEVKR